MKPPSPRSLHWTRTWYYQASLGILTNVFKKIRLNRNAKLFENYIDIRYIQQFVCLILFKME